MDICLSSLGHGQESVIHTWMMVVAKGGLKKNGQHNEGGQHVNSQLQYESGIGTGNLEEASVQTLKKTAKINQNDDIAKRSAASRWILVRIRKVMSLFMPPTPIMMIMMACGSWTQLCPITMMSSIIYKHLSNLTMWRWAMIPHIRYNTSKISRLTTTTTTKIGSVSRVSCMFPRSQKIQCPSRGMQVHFNKGVTLGPRSRTNGGWLHMEEKKSGSLFSMANLKCSAKGKRVPTLSYKTNKSNTSAYKSYSQANLEGS